MRKETLHLIITLISDKSTRVEQHHWKTFVSVKMPQWRVYRIEIDKKLKKFNELIISIHQYIVYLSIKAIIKRQKKYPNKRERDTIVLVLSVGRVYTILSQYTTSWMVWGGSNKLWILVISYTFSFLPIPKKVTL